MAAFFKRFEEEEALHGGNTNTKQIRI